MAERNLGRPWSDEEDKLLTEAVALHGEQDRWKIIALSVPGRTNKACRKRWLHSLSPTIRKSAWTADEDHRLMELYNRHGSKWSTIAREIPGRTDDACSKRYREALDPNLKKDEWTPAEDAKLIEVYAKIGGKWGQVGQELQRSGLGCRNRWRLLERKASRAVNDAGRSQISDIQDFRVAQAEGTQRALEQEDAPPPNWPPYYPPEAYPSFPSEENSNLDHRFREPTPEVVSVSPHVAPFQFSSSSLSAALSDPPRHPRSLPPVYECEPASSASSSPFHSGIIDYIQHQMSQDEFSSTNEEDQNELARILSRTRFDAHGVAYFIGDNDVSLLSSPLDVAPHNIYDGWETILPELLTLPPSDRPSTHSLESIPINHNISDDVSSALSTPFNFASSLSPSPSPNTGSPVELPVNDHIGGSLLFSPDHHFQPPRRVSPKKMPKKLYKHQGPTRLSSLLTLTPDPSVRPYACGREQCWPVEAPASSACFATSKELFDHSKVDHAKDPPGERPFRCALSGCGKSWKSLNGLQYHLQLSTAHFRNALSSSFSAQKLSNVIHRRQSTTPGSSTEADTPDEAKRTYVCHHPQCFKAYRQPSGLRYHLKHGHPQEMPVQLPVVPPALARQMPSKTRKMRRKASTEGDP